MGDDSALVYSALAGKAKGGSAFVPKAQRESSPQTISNHMYNLNKSDVLYQRVLRSGCS